MRYKPYSNYKIVDLPWLKRVPEHWIVQPNRAIFNERNMRGFINEQMLSITIKKGVILQREMIKKSSKKDSSNEDKSKYKLVLEGDFTYNKMRMWQGAVGLSQYKGIVSPAYIVLQPKIITCSKYFHYLLRIPEYNQICHSYSHGICDDQMSLRYEDFKVILSFTPPLSEQIQIAKFLDHKTTQINRLIQKKKRLIALLKEQKQAIINQAVTKGIDPNVKLKPSGVEWLGDVPEYWEVSRLKNQGSIFGRIGFRGYTKEDIVDEGFGALSLSPSNIVNNYINLDKKTFISWQKYEESPEIQVLKNNIILVKTGSSYGKVALFEEINTSVTINPQLVVIKNIKIIPKFLLACISSSYIQNQFSRKTIGGAIPTLTQASLSDANIVIPSRKEQEKIVCFIEEKTLVYEKGIVLCQREIELIQEYRKRLISDAVTGKIDVRDIRIDESTPKIELDDVIDSEEIEEQLELVGVGDEND